MFEKLFQGASDIGNFLDTITTGANQKAVAAQETAQVAVTEKGKIADSAADYATEAQTTLQRLQRVEAVGAEARRMAESDNIFDRISLIGEQMINPRDYTLEGRQNQVSEMSTTLAVRGQIHNVEVNASAAKIDQAIAQEAAATAGVDARMNMLRTQVDGLQLANAAIAQTETLRQQNLMQVDLPSIQKTLMGPQQNNKIAINGMEYTPAEVREREKALTTRNQLSMLAPQATDPEFAQKLRVHHDLQLSNFALPELELLKSNHYIMPDGTQVEPGLWDAHYTRQNQMQQDTLNRQLNEQQLTVQVPAMLDQSMKLSKSVGAYATPGTPLAIANANFLAAANTVATVAAKDQTPVGKIAQVTALGRAQEQLVKTVESEALRKAAGDKELSVIYRSQMLGEEISPAQIEDVVRARYVKGKGFGDIFADSDVSLRIRKNADENFAKRKQMAAQGALDPMSPTKSEKELKEEAVVEALEQERNTAGVKGINMIQNAVSQRKDNPAIKAGMVPLQLNETQMRAHQMAIDNVKHREGLTDEQVLQLKNGNPAAAGISPERAAMLAQQINIESVMTEYDLFEQTKPGLGYEMQQWYAATLPELARNYTMNLDPIQQVLTGDSVLGEAQKLGAMYTMADESASQRGRQLATELATGAKKPENMWPVLLQMNSRLADSQKQTIFYDVIMPAVNAARAQGANDEVTTNAVFTALTTYKSDDPTLMSAIKITQRELPQELDRFQTMWATMMARNQPNRIRAQVVGKDPDLAGKQIDSVLPWLNRN